MCADWLAAQEPPVSLLSAESKDIRAWFRHLREARGRNRGGQQANYRALRAFCNWLVAEEIIDKSPLTKIELSGEHRVVEPFSAKDVAALLKAAGETRHPLRDTLIITLLIETGIRLGELAALSVGDVTTRTMTVRGKGNKQRTVPLNAEISRAVRRYLHKERSESDEPGLLLSDADAALTAHGIGEVVCRLGIKAGVPHCHPHRFRHTYATVMASALKDPWLLAGLLGHTTPQITSRYVKNQVIVDGAANVSVLKMLQEKKK